MKDKTLHRESTILCPNYFCPWQVKNSLFNKKSISNPHTITSFRNTAPLVSHGWLGGTIPRVLKLMVLSTPSFPHCSANVIPHKHNYVEANTAVEYKYTATYAFLRETQRITLMRHGNVCSKEDQSGDQIN